VFEDNDVALIQDVNRSLHGDQIAAQMLVHDLGGKWAARLIGQCDHKEIVVGVPALANCVEQ
jgi:hypothetical protein